MENYVDNQDYEKFYENICQIKISDDKQAIELVVNKIANVIKNTKKEVNFDKIIYRFTYYILKLQSSLEKEKDENLDNLKNVYNNKIRDIKFEKNALIEIQKLLKKSIIDNDYYDLDIIYLILASIIFMKRIRKIDISNELEIYSASLKNITFIPASNDDIGITIPELKDYIDTNIKVLKLINGN